MTKYTLPFAKLNNKSVALAGGKGASLGEMTKAKLPVPPGFVVLAGAFDKFIENKYPPKGSASGDLNVLIEGVLDKVKYNDVNSIEKASAAIHEMIMESSVLPEITKEVQEGFKKLKAKWVAVRSSATAEDSKVASWAGELETYLFVDQKRLLETVKKCWASLFTPRAIFYRYEKKLHKAAVSVAVVIQKMVESEISGVAFSVHPVTKDRNQLIIEAGYGLGEAIVSGTITPDTYVVHKKELSILDINISDQKQQIIFKPGGGSILKPVAKTLQAKQKLSGRQIIELSKIIINIEKHYGLPMDIEWAINKGKFYLLQARPITTL